MSSKAQSRIALLLTAILFLGTGAALAAGGTPMPDPTSPRSSMPSPPPMSPEDEAALLYNQGLKHQEKGDKLARDAEAQAVGSEKRAKLEAKARKEFEKAREDFQEAVAKHPGSYQAHSGLGYTLRKTGSYDAALEAYGRALALQPKYAPAVEYQAEAYLGLNRIEEAKEAYVKLFGYDRKHADELHAAMKKWLEARRRDAQGVAPEVLDDLTKWLAQREEIATQTSALQQKDGRW